jgi:predicted lipoprotein with Yx(FWY)xxD motif
MRRQRCPTLSRGVNTLRHLLRLSLPALAASLLLAACGSSSTSSNTTSSAASTQPAAQTGSSSSGAVVKTASNSLGTILVNSQGMTLYHLSGEVNGKFICTSSACLGVWHPLIASSSGTPSGEVSSLGTVKRPEGTMQVTYNGTPLYTFAQDKQAGETNGQGIKDVGTWSAATTSASSTPAASTSSSSESEKSSGGSSSGGGYGY